MDLCIDHLWEDTGKKLLTTILTHRRAGWLRTKVREVDFSAYTRCTFWILYHVYVLPTQKTEYLILKGHEEGKTRERKGKKFIGKGKESSSWSAQEGAQNLLHVIWKQLVSSVDVEDTT